MRPLFLLDEMWTFFKRIFHIFLLTFLLSFFRFFFKELSKLNDEKKLVGICYSFAAMTRNTLGGPYYGRLP